MSIKKIISGGQTGADQAALDVALKYDIPHGGAVPKGRLTEAGVLPAKYRLEELPTKSYPDRTEKNVVDSDATVILTRGKLTGGSLLTREKALEHGRPVLHLDMDDLSINDAVELLTNFVNQNGIKNLNVAGKRASEDGLIYEMTFQVVEGVVERYRE